MRLKLQNVHAFCPVVTGKGVMVVYPRSKSSPDY